jgi:amino-acid N-acetyltransferase
MLLNEISFMPAKITVTPAASANRQAIEVLLVSQKLPVEDLPASLENFWIAEDGGGIIGVAGLELYQPYGLLRSLAVSPVHRNLGLGNILVRTVEEQAARLALESIYLLTETAKLYFEKRGYTVVERDHVPDAIKRSPEFSHVCPVSAAVMQKRITA